jgi:2-methylcitrate dehydratase PrpD
MPIVAQHAHHNMTDAARTLADFALGLDPSRIPDEVAERACLHILDALGVALAATTYPFARRGLAAIGSMAGGGDYPVIGRPERLAMRDAAIANGFLIHGLDFDDTHGESIVHTSASAVPTVLAAGLNADATGAEALAAYLVAVEADARIGSVGGAFQKRGFHPTGVVGAFGATLAAGRLWRMDPAALARAQGITLSLAGGTLQFLEDGAWTKRIHPGWAAACGLQAAGLARGGFTGPAQAYEGRFGLYRTYLGEEWGEERDEPCDHDGGQEAGGALASRLTDLGERWEMLRVGIKPYPVCHYNHAYADCVLALVSEHGITPDDVDRMVARVHADEVDVVCEPEARKRRPQSDYEAKFSVQYLMAATLVKRRFTLDELEDDVLVDPDILALADRCGYEVDPESTFPRYFPGEVVVHTRDGRELRHHEPVNRGADQRPLSRADIVAKFEDNAGRALARPAVRSLRDHVLDLPSLPRLATIPAAIPATIVGAVTA